MATFRKRGKNWEYRVRYTDPITGKKKESSKGGFRTKADAEYAASQAFLDTKDGITKKNDNIRFSDYLDIWWSTYKGSIKETSLRSRLSSIGVLKKCFQELQLKDLTLSLYQKTLNEQAENYSKNYLISINQIAQMVMKKATREGYFRFNPIADAKIPYYETREKFNFWEPVIIHQFQKLSHEDIEKKRKPEFRHVAYEKQRDLALYYCCMYGGLRPGEACALQIHDYYPITKEINIDKTLSSPAVNQTLDTYRLYPPKTKNAYRTVPLPEIAYKQIENWIRLRNEYKLLKRQTFQESQFLFCKKTGQPLTPRDIRIRFNALLKKYDLPKIGMHGLRHTYTSLQIQAGIDPKSLQLLLGHADIKTTLNVYAHLTKDKKQENIKRFDKMLKNLESGAKAGQYQNPAESQSDKTLDTKVHER